MLSSVQCRIIKDIQKKKLEVDYLKIPRPQVTSIQIESETQDNEKEIEKENEKKVEKNRS